MVQQQYDGLDGRGQEHLLRKRTSSNSSVVECRAGDKRSCTNTSGFSAGGGRFARAPRISDNRGPPLDATFRTTSKPKPAKKGRNRGDIVRSDQNTRTSIDRPSNAWCLYLYAGSNSAAPLGAFERSFFVPRPASVEVQPPARPAEARGRRLGAPHQSAAGEMSRLVASWRCRECIQEDGVDANGEAANFRAGLRGRISGMVFALQRISRLVKFVSLFKCCVLQVGKRSPEGT